MTKTATATVYIFDFTQKNGWEDRGNVLFLDGEEIADGYFHHLEDSDVVEQAVVAYINDAPDSLHIVTVAQLQGWLSVSPDNANDYHWIETALDYLVVLNNDKCRMMDLLDGNKFVRIEVPLPDYIDYANDPKIDEELEKMWDEKRGRLVYDTVTIKEAHKRAYKHLGLTDQN